MSNLTIESIKPCCFGLIKIFTARFLCNVCPDQNPHGFELLPWVDAGAVDDEKSCLWIPHGALQSEF